MKTNANDPINPIIDSYEDGNVFTAKDGISKLEYFSAIAMQGILSSQSRTITPETAAKWSVKCAKELIIELNNQQ